MRHDFEISVHSRDAWLLLVFLSSLASTRNAQAAGGFKVRFDGRLRVFYPALCLIINDNPEGNLQALVKDSARVPSPCRMCW